MIWSGLGFLAAVVTFGFCLLLNFVLDAQFGEGYYSSHYWTLGAALLLGGVFSAGIGFALKGRSDRFAIDEETGERLIVSSNSHTFFFMPLHWAGVVISLIGIVFIVLHILGFVPPPGEGG